MLIIKKNFNYSSFNFLDYLKQTTLLPSLPSLPTLTTLDNFDSLGKLSGSLTEGVKGYLNIDSARGAKLPLLFLSNKSTDKMKKFLNPKLISNLPRCGIEIKCFDRTLLQKTIFKINSLINLIFPKIKKKDFKHRNQTHNYLFRSIVDHPCQSFLSFSAMKLPSKKSMISLLRSPHIDKRSQEHFEKKSYKYFFSLNILTEVEKKNLLIFCQRLKYLQLAGCQLKLKLQIPAYSYTVLTI